MFFKTVFPGKYIQGEGALGALPELVSLLGENGLILTSHTGANKILPQYTKDWKGKPIPTELFKGECCEKELNRITEIIHREKVDVLICMGGGKAIDTAKITADRSEIPVIIVPTIAATDAPCSGCAVIYSEAGVFESVYYQKMNPQVVLVDTCIIANAPVRFLVAGMGDALATWFEGRSCERTQSPNECGGISTMTAIRLARLCYDTLLTYGTAAKKACEKHLVTPALDHIIEANILLSGIGFESSGLGAAHSIHNGLTAIEETHSFYHGEKVAFGMLAGLFLTDASPEEIDTVYGFCEKVGLPTTLAHIGLKNPEQNKMRKAAEKACASTEGIHHEAVVISPEKVLNAMLMADSYGQSRGL
ncbi:MAG TPA: glycerol dehydrogenase [Syntrophales bacterium]|jgi:glycerol dehydrogenase|nr:glycerol dehydrogenase [Syntrophales bacterium]HPX55190.1 glycerol dehydrogenase [Syntrophales bacterium]HQA83299.1 glycerol dehydrogenase [Syntrophales bacterium]